MAWIACADELPPYGKRVLIYVPKEGFHGDCVTIGVSYGQGHWGTLDDLASFTEITHWQLMPAPPGDDSRDALHRMGLG